MTIARHSALLQIKHGATLVGNLSVMGSAALFWWLTPYNGCHFAWLQPGIITLRACLFTQFFITIEDFYYA